MSQLYHRHQGTVLLEMSSIYSCDIPPVSEAEKQDIKRKKKKKKTKQNNRQKK